MTGPVRLLDVDHDQVGVLILLERAQRDAGLIGHEGTDLVFVYRLELSRIGKGRNVEARAETLHDAEVRLRRPEADVAVDVVDGGERGRVARNKGGRIAREAHQREIGRERADEERGADLQPAAFEEEPGGRAADSRVSGAGRGQRERTGCDGARGAGVEEHQRVVVHDGIVAGIDRSRTDGEEKGARRGRRCPENAVGRGVAADDALQHARHPDRAVRDASCSGERGRDAAIVSGKICSALLEALCAEPPERTERDGVVHRAGRDRALHDRGSRGSGQGHIDAVRPRPSGGGDLPAGCPQLHPERLGSHCWAGAERADPIATDRPAEPAGRAGDRLRHGVVGIRRDVVVRRGRARRDGDVADGSE